MASTDTSTVLRRMLVQSPTHGASGVASAFKPFASLLEKLADRSLSLPLGVTEIHQKPLSREGVLQGFEAPILMLRLRAGQGPLGMAGLCPHLRAALIEVQTTGKVAATPPPDRAATDADAAICAGFISDLFAQSNATLDPAPGAIWSTIFAVDGHFQSPRALGLALDDVPFSHVTLQFDLGNGARQGCLTLLLPQAAKRAAPAANTTWRTAMNEAVNDAPVPLTAVLHRQVLSLVDVENLVVGDTIALPRVAASQITLEARDTRVGPFKLGQIGGQKALRRVPDAPQAAAPLSPEPALAPQPASDDPTLEEPVPQDSASKSYCAAIASICGRKCSSW